MGVVFCISALHVHVLMVSSERTLEITLCVDIHELL